MPAIASQKPSRVSPRANKGIFTSTKFNLEPAPSPSKSRKRKNTKNAPKAIRKAKKTAKARVVAPKKAAPATPVYRSREDRAADRPAPGRVAAELKAKL
ncbi:MAG: hypothetical protein Q9175_003594 [Cornicularia normoerica]